MRNLFILLCSCLLFACATESSENHEGKEMKETLTEKAQKVMKPDSVMRHVVMFKFSETSTPEDIKKIEAAFVELSKTIPQVRDFDWGINNSPEGLNKGLTHCFLVTFHSEADREAYLPHPDHQAFVAMLDGHVADVTVMDYWTK